MRIPNFFIVGAPKSGTTALSEYLRLHPDIFLSTPKEPHYFATDLPGYQCGRTEAEYLSLFPQEKNSAKLLGESSVYYLYSDIAIENIYKFNKDAKLIVMLRNPVDLVYSLHAQLLYSRNEDESDFGRAWALQELRKNNVNIPKYCTDPKILQYFELGKLGEQVERLFRSSFRREQLHFIVFEEFVKDTKGVYNEVLDFLEVEGDGREDFPVINANTKHRFPWLGGLYINTPPWLSSTVKYSKKVLGIKRLGLSRHVEKINTVRVKRPSMTLAMRQTLNDAYSDDITKLSRLVDKDLGCWLE